MAYAGGGFTAYNKTVPGVYVNFISSASAGAAISQRGCAAVGLELPWGAEDEIKTVTYEELCANSYALFGAEAADELLRPVRDIFKNAEKLVYYRLNGDGAKATCAAADAKYAGTAGNKIRIAVSADIDGGFVVTTYFGSVKADEQRVNSSAELVGNDFVVFKKDFALEPSAGISMEGGTNGTATREKHQRFLSLAESVSFDTLGFAGSDSGLKSLYSEYTIRMREKGVKFQTVLYDMKADHEGIINFGNTAKGQNPAAGVYWATGLCAGVKENETAFNRVYDGEYELVADSTLAELEQGIKEGVFMLHRVGSELRVLADINSLVSASPDKGAVFRQNRTVRVTDRIANDTAALFVTKYMGKYLNNNAGRTALWSDIVSLFRSLSDSGAVDGFDSEDISVETAGDKESVVVKLSVNIPGAMEKLYMTCVIE